ncbi:hypothetical protein [Streptomyces tailanensis]|uniref:hypothetical protein n=1 Tax=Streptomyces tailanensis TaxID=2569858 RepID=UPI00122E0B79|nr:hypothetical protein [Streptomyces tailanensis]
MNTTPEHPEAASEAAPEAKLCGARRYDWQRPGRPGSHRLPCLLPGGHDGDHRDAFNSTWFPACGDRGDCGTAASPLETLTVPEPDGTFRDGPACGPCAGWTAAPGRPERQERRPVRMCVRCDVVTDRPVIVSEVHQATGPGFNVYACPDCAPHFPPVPDVLSLLTEARRREGER